MRHTFVAALLLFTLTTVWCAKNAGLSSTISESVLGEIRRVFESHPVSDIHGAFFSSHSHDKVDPTVGSYARSILSSKEAQSPEAIFRALSVADALKLSDVPVEKALSSSIKDTIANADSLTDFYYAGLSALSLRARGNKDITESDLTNLADKVIELSEGDGTFRGSSEDTDGSMYYTGLALELLGKIIKEAKGSINVDDIEKVVDNIDLSLGNEADGALSFSHSDESVTPFASTAALLRGLSTFKAATKVPESKASSTHISQMAHYLLGHKGVTSPADAHHLLSSLRALHSGATQPIVLSLDRASIASTAKGAEGHLRVRITDVFDQPVPVSKVYLTKAHPVGKDSHVLISNQELTQTDDHKSYFVNFLATKPEQGFYALEFRVVPEKDSKYIPIDSTTRTVKVFGSIAITDFEITVADSKEELSKASDAHKYRAADETHKIDDVIEISQSQHVGVQFRVRGAGGSNKAVTVQQAFVKFTHAETGHEVVFVATPNDNKLYTLVVVVDASTFKSVGGNYRLEVIAGDSFIQNPVHWLVAKSVKVVFSANATTTRNVAGAAQPEIVHQFRVPEARPLAAVSTFFTLAVLSPLAFLFIGFLTVGANISQFPFSGTDFIYAVGFVGCVGAVLSLMALYWLQLNLVQTLAYLAVLSVPTVFFGQRALSQIARRKEKFE